MDTPQERPNEESVSDRLDFMEDRLDQAEEQQRLRSMEDRLEGLEQDRSHDDEEDHPSNIEGEGQKAFRLALANLLNNEAVVNAVAELTKTVGNALTEWSGLKGKQLEAQKKVALRTYYSGLAFSAFVLLFLGALLWYDKISKELAAGLIGSLIGYWYGRHEKEKG
jgi:cysteinyl-tRNA synthetase